MFCSFLSSVKMKSCIIICTLIFWPSCFWASEVIRPMLSQDFLKKFDRLNHGRLESCSEHRNSCFVEWSPKEFKTGETYELNTLCTAEASFYSGKELIVVEDAATSEILFNTVSPLACRGLKSKLDLDKLHFRENNVANLKCPLDANDIVRASIIYEIPEYFPLNAVLGTYKLHWKVTNDLNQVVFCVQGLLEIASNVEIDDEDEE